MILTILSVFLFILFTLLGGIHIYWLFGGKWGLGKVIPTKTNESGTTKIPKIATLIVAVILISFGLVYLIKSGLIAVVISDTVIYYVGWFIPVIFMLRTIGEFKYVGLFKKIKDTEFAKADTKMFSPLCLFISLAGLGIQLLG